MNIRDKLKNMAKKGMVYVFSGDGKGKTSAALGVAMRMLLLGKKVVWISWYKSESWEISEKRLTNYFADNLKMYWAGKGFYIKGGSSAKVNKAVVFDYDTPEGHRKAAHEAVDVALKYLEKQNNEEIDLMVLDEINQTVKDGLLENEDIVKLIENRGTVNLVLTGRNFPEELIERADLYTEMKKNKHPFDKGVMAEKGLDF